MIQKIKDKVIGIYCIENKINNKKYIGKSNNIRKRWTLHKHEFNNNKHSNDHFQKSYNKYGLENFDFYVIEIFDEYNEEIIIERERHYIKFYKTRNPEYGYNLTDGGEGCVGRVCSEQTKETLRNKRKGIFKLSDEAKEKIAIAATGRKDTEQTKLKRSQSQKNRIYDKKAWGEACSKRQKGIPQPWSEDRVVTKKHKENVWKSSNNKKRKGNNNHIGIYFGKNKKSKPWTAIINIGVKNRKFLGNYATEKEAIDAWENFYFEFYGTHYKEESEE